MSKHIRYSYIILLTILLFYKSPTYSQTIPSNVSSINVNSLSETQIKEIQQKIKENNLSLTQAIELAKAKGATQTQINELTRRLNSFDLNSDNKTDIAYENISKEDSILKTRSLSVKKELPKSETNNNLFGYDLFNKKNLTFQPSSNIPVSDDYTIEPGDEITINIWGASQQTYALTVNKNGNINIPDIGPIRVSGINFSEISKTIKKRLTSIYNGMLGEKPNTFAEINVTGASPIQINIIGEAFAPGTYTIPATASAFNALYLSGGPNKNGSFRTIRIFRDNKLYKTIDIYEYLINGKTSENISLRNQDIIYIPTYYKRVETMGAFKRNKIFEMKSDEDFNQLIKFAGGFKPNASINGIMITRIQDDQYNLIDLKKSQFSSFQMKNGDIVYAKSSINKFKNRLTITGAVQRPGTYGLTKDMKLSELITKAGGLLPEYFEHRGLIIRLDDKYFPTTIPFEIDKVMDGTKDIALKKEDRIIIRDIFSIGEKKTVQINGEVIKPGEYTFNRNLSIEDLIFKAGGLKEAASNSYIEIARRNSYQTADSVTNKMASIYRIKIDRNLKLKDKDKKFILKPFDQVYVRRAPSYQAQQNIIISGEVKYPGVYSIISKDEKISDVIKRAGGLLPSAFSEGATLERDINSQDQYKQQLKSIENIEQLDSTINIKNAKKPLKLELRLADILKNPGASYDYYLRKGDHITIPKKSEEIWINGEVLNPMGLAYENGRGVKYYIKNAGGLSSNSKKGKIYVIYGNGVSKATSSILFWKKYPEIKPGCQIIVPKKPERTVDNTAKYLSIASTFASVAVALAAVLN